MPNEVLEVYKTLTLEAQQEVEHLIYFLSSQQKRVLSSENSNNAILDSFIGKCNSWNGEDALSYQKKLRNEERV